jgi:hypothetical protein
VERIEYVTSIDDPLVSAVIIEMNGVIFIIFRGTVISLIRFVCMLSDVFADGRFAKESATALGEEISFHRGFFRAATATFEGIFSAIKNHCAARGILHPIVYVAGHSLGGAMAAILNAHWNHGKYDSDQLCSFSIRSTYTFGMPRFGDAKTMDELRMEQCLGQTKYLRTTTKAPFGSTLPYHLSNLGDSVPHLPVHYLEFGNSFEEWSTVNGARVDFEIKNREDDLAFQNLFNLSGIKGHEIDLYIDNTLPLATNGIKLE